MTPKEMCNSCTHENYCMGAYRKDHWCGNHTRKDRKMKMMNLTAGDLYLGFSLK